MLVRLTVFVLSHDLNIQHCFLYFFVMINLSAVALFVLGGNFNISNSLS